jgi:hypothetical protein
MFLLSLKSIFDIMTEVSEIFGYRRGDLHVDLALGLSSLLAGAIFCAAAWNTTFILGLFVVMTLLALYFSIRTLWRYQIQFQFDETGLWEMRSGSTRLSLQWNEIQALRLRYYGSKGQREKGKGTMNLRLQNSRGRKIDFDSGVVNFDKLAVACKNFGTITGTMDGTSAANFESLGSKAFGIGKE